MSITYFSTQNPSGANQKPCDLGTVIMSGLATDGGLFLPERVPTFTAEKLLDIRSQSFSQIVLDVLDVYLDGVDANIQMIKSEITNRFTFEPKLIQYSDHRYLLDLNTGPTSAFKDYGANTLSALMNGFLSTENRQKTIIVATSGDTGSAVANAFKDFTDTPNINVVVMYPKGMVSDDQRRLMTTIGSRQKSNIYCIEVDGTFDDCQNLAKMALNDTTICSQLTSANSINWGRLLGQIPYYIWAKSRLPLQNTKTHNTKTQNTDPIFSVPSGNLGNITAGYLAHLMGNTTEKFILAHNINSPVESLVLDGVLDYRARATATHSSAMDVCDPSNLKRLIHYFSGQINTKGDFVIQPDISKIQSMFYAEGFSDDQTVRMMSEFYQKTNMMVCPYTAVGLLGVEAAVYGENAEHPEYRNRDIITLSTADPSKFPDICHQVYGEFPNPTNPILTARGEKEEIYELENNFLKLKEFMIKIGLVRI